MDVIFEMISLLEFGGDFNHSRLLNDSRCAVSFLHNSDDPGCVSFNLLNLTTECSCLFTGEGDQKSTCDSIGSTNRVNGIIAIVQTTAWLNRCHTRQLDDSGRAVSFLHSANDPCPLSLNLLNLTTECICLITGEGDQKSTCDSVWCINKVRLKGF